MAVYKHTFKVVVFSEDKEIDRFDTLSDIDYAISEDHCIGSIEHESTEKVADENLSTELKDIGNDGSFFDPI